MAFRLWELGIICPFAIFTCLFLMYVYRKRNSLNDKRNHKTFALRIDQIIAADVEVAQKAREAYTDVKIEREVGDFAPGDKVITSATDGAGRITGIVKQRKGQIFQVEMSRGYPNRPKLQMFKAEQLELDNTVVKPMRIPDKYTVEVMEHGRTPSPFRQTRSNDSTEAITQGNATVDQVAEVAGDAKVTQEENAPKRTTLTRARARPKGSKRLPQS